MKSVKQLGVVAGLVGCLVIGGNAEVAAQGGVGKRPAVPGGLTDKPYLKNLTGGIAIGGYMDHEFFLEEESSTFDQHRFIPFIYATPTDYIHVSAEIEFEHGGNVGGDGEIKLEYAIMDWLLDDAFNVRGGVILSPLGRFNLLHDSPLNDLTNRPLVSRQLIPTTLSESGFGVFGAFYPSEWVIAYEAYLVNGFDNGVISGDRLRVRGGRGSQKDDNNENKALVGRISVSPMLGIDFAASVHTGAYDDAGENNLTIAAFDWDVVRGPFQVVGEAALVSADVDQPGAGLAAASLADAIAESQAGFYAQVSYHFGFGAIKRYPNSVFTGIARFDLVDFDSDVDGDDQQIATVGLNFRPVESAVAKIDYRWEWSRARGMTTWSTPDNLLSLSLATYF
ncbi:MAG: hypothetical protein Kow0074_13510 [Candidatus Zixiibacteriota bacterium]